MKVLFTRSIIAGGQHRDAGSTAELDPKEAAERIASGDAVPARQGPETAISPAAPENAGLPPAKKTKEKP